MHPGADQVAIADPTAFGMRGGRWRGFRRGGGSVTRWWSSWCLRWCGFGAVLQWSLVALDLKRSTVRARHAGLVCKLYRCVVSIHNLRSQRWLCRETTLPFGSCSLVWRKLQGWRGRSCGGGTGGSIFGRPVKYQHHVHSHVGPSSHIAIMDLASRRAS